MSDRRIVAVTGASGLIGRALGAELARRGVEVRPLARSVLSRMEALVPAIAGAAAVVHLAGENIAGGRWTASRKERILGSRTTGTQAIARAVVSAPGPRPVLVCASAIGYYGNRGASPVDESAEAGTGFLAEVVRAWESAADPARTAGCRVVHARFGVVLDRAGGALAKMLPAFRLGAGGPIGSGRQGFSWIGIDDAVAAILFAIDRADLDGPVNVTAPAPVSQREFARTLGKVLRRPALVPLPAFVVRALFGEMGTEMLLSGAFVVPRRLLDAGFAFRHADCESAVRRALGC